MNDPFYSSREMEVGSSQAESIFNEIVPRTAAGLATIQSRTLSTPPGTPNQGDAYLVNPTGTDAWAGLDNNIVVWLDDWLVMPVQAGMQFMIADEQYKHVEMTGAGGLTGAADSGSTTITPEFITGSWRINWNVIHGSIAVVPIENHTILMTPTNMLPGRRYVLRILQDNTGNWSLSLEVGGWYSVLGVAAVDIELAANRWTDIIIQGPSTGFDLPVVYQTFKDLRVVTS